MWGGGDRGGEGALTRHSIDMLNAMPVTVHSKVHNPSLH